MMMDCPRCGFAQPKDRYCANCGLDVDHFKPKPESKLKQLVQSAAFQITAVAIIVVALGSGIYTSQQKQITAKFNAVEAGLVEPTTPGSSDSALDPASAANSASAPSQNNATQTAMGDPAIQPTSATGESQMVESTGAQEVSVESTFAADSKTATAPATPVKNLNIQFLEIPRLMAEQLAGENQILDRSGNTYSFVILSQPNASSLGTGVRPLPGSTNRPASTTQKIELSFQQQQATTGMIVDFNTLNITEQDIEFEVMSQIALWDPSTQKISNITFNGKYTIPNGSTLVIVGLLPHQQVRQEDQSIFAGTPLSIMTSAAFKNNSTEFALFIQPK